MVKKLEEKEKEWKEMISDKDKKVQSLEKEKAEAHKQIAKLRDALKLAEGTSNVHFFHYLFNFNGRFYQTDSLQKRLNILPHAC